MSTTDGLDPSTTDGLVPPLTTGAGGASRWWHDLLPWRRFRSEPFRARLALYRVLPGAGGPLGAVMLALVVAGAAGETGAMLARGMLLGALPDTLRHGFDSPSGRVLAVALALNAALFVLPQLLGSLDYVLNASFQRRVNLHLRDRAMAALWRPPGVAHLEDPATLDFVRDVQGMGTGVVTPGAAAAGLARIASLHLNALSSAVLVGVFYRWWLAAVLVAVRAAGRTNILHGVLKSLEVVAGQTPVLRRADYLRETATTPAAAKEVRVFGLEGFLLGRFVADWTAAMTRVWRERERGGRLGLGVLVIVLAAIGGTALVGIDAATGGIGLGALTVLLGAVFGATTMGVSDSDYALNVGSRGVLSLLALERAPSGMKGTLDAAGMPRTGVRFENVTFRYAGRPDDVLRGLDLDIPAGRSLAIVGANGAGKTTIVKLLARLYDPTAGRITVDGTDLREIGPRTWQRRVGAIFQDFVRYELPASDNVGFGAHEMARDGDALQRAAAQAGASTIIRDLPSGWDTPLSRLYSGGTELSGGEWQRIALARAIFAVQSGAGVLVLDEPAANLDVRAEADLYDRLLEITGGVTTLLISHRFSTVRRADRIVVVEAGRVTEQGTHEELMTLRGSYARMFSLQASRFADDA